MSYLVSILEKKHLRISLKKFFIQFYSALFLPFSAQGAFSCQEERLVVVVSLEIKSHIWL